MRSSNHWQALLRASSQCKSSHVLPWQMDLQQRCRCNRHPRRSCPSAPVLLSKQGIACSVHNNRHLMCHFFCVCRER